jgi:hypothetical protein
MPVGAGWGDASQFRGLNGPEPAIREHGGLPFGSRAPKMQENPFLELTRNATVPAFGVRGRNRTGVHRGVFGIFR